MSTYLLRKQLLTIAENEIGVTEVGDSNSGKRVREYQASTNLEGTGWPWCAAFVCWCIREWGKDSNVRDALKLTKEGFEEWRPKTAAAFGFHAWGKKNGLLVMDDSQSNILHTGDIMTFDMSHVGFVNDDKGTKVYTVEGNTSTQGSRDGGGVYAKVRNRSLGKMFVRPLA